MCERICVAVLLHARLSIRCTKWEEFQAPPTSRQASFFLLIFFFCQWGSLSPNSAQFPPLLLSPSSPPTTLNSNLTSRHVEKLSTFGSCTVKKNHPKQQNVLCTTTHTHGNVAGRSNLNSLARLVNIQNSPTDTSGTGTNSKFGNCTLNILSLLIFSSHPRAPPLHCCDCCNRITEK